jgi:hypothetical protein
MSGVRSSVDAVGDRPELLVAPCSIEAARFAVERWHYARILPTGKANLFGAWEDGQFVGVAIYSRGASPNLGRNLGFDTLEVCELTRLALSPQVDRSWPTSAVLARSLRLVRRQNPDLSAVLSFADPVQKHVGRIYQATGWLYLGRSTPNREYRIGGRWRHVRGAWHHPDRPNAPTRIVEPKYRYGYPFTRPARRRFEAAAEPPP